MALILNIDTSVTNASFCFSLNGKMIASEESKDPRSHASWLHEAIRTSAITHNVALKTLGAIAVTIGPGSYTGLRVGLAAAKGFSFALGIPLITIGTLEMMAGKISVRENELVCPMIDARRQEVFTAVFDHRGLPIIQPCAMILDENSFNDLLTLHRIIFAGNGRQKLADIIDHPSAVFVDDEFTAVDMISISDRFYSAKQFADLAYTQPLYLKEFFFTGNTVVKNT